MTEESSGIAHADLTSCLNLENAGSIGFKSGEYGGRCSSLAPADSISGKRQGNPKLKLLGVVRGGCVAKKLVTPSSSTMAAGR